MRIDSLITMAQGSGASDLHLEPGLPAAIRVRGNLRTTGELISGATLLEMAREVIGHDNWNSFVQRRSYDLSRTIQGVRCRINVLQSSRGVGFAIRLLSSFQATIETLNLHPEIKRHVAHPNGLIIVSGATGSGKSSTMAALLQEINLTEARHIVTIESPIEYVFRPRLSYIRQREVGRDTPSFEQGLLDSLREDPDVLMVGEMRDPETMRLTLNASETGHLVLTTTHSSSCAEALQRIVSAFPSEIQNAVRAQLADCLVAVICQRLRYRPDLKIRLPECEIVVSTHPVKNHIRAGDFFKIMSMMETGADHGMWTFQRYQMWMENKKTWHVPSADETAETDPAEAVLTAPWARRQRHLSLAPQLRRRSQSSRLPPRPSRLAALKSNPPKAASTSCSKNWSEQLIPTPTPTATARQRREECMTKRRFLTFLFILAVALGLWALLHKKPELPTPPASVDVQNQSPQSLPDQTAPSTQQAPPPVAPTPSRPRGSHAGSTVVVEGVPISQAVIDYTRNSRADPQYDWKQPINFYGKVVDENGAPVPGASIHFTWNDLSPQGTSHADTASDENGLFSLTDRQGKRLYVEISKGGYYTSGNARGAAFEYASPADGLFTPDAANPVMFHLRKKGEAAQLIHGLKLFGSREGTLSYVDLTTAKAALTPPGDLTVQCTRSERNADKKFDWTFTLGVPGGGLIESTDEFMFLAPESGYQPSFQISHRINDPDWTGQEKHKFFVRNLDGQHHARIEITIMPDYGQNAAYDLEWYLNPNGSRNLESDPDKMTNVQ